MEKLEPQICRCTRKGLKVMPCVPLAEDEFSLKPGSSGVSDAYVHSPSIFFVNLLL